MRLVAMFIAFADRLRPEAQNRRGRREPEGKLRTNPAGSDAENRCSMPISGLKRGAVSLSIAGRVRQEQRRRQDIAAGDKLLALDPMTPKQLYMPEGCRVPRTPPESKYSGAGVGRRAQITTAPTKDADEAASWKSQVACAKGVDHASTPVSRRGESTQSDDRPGRLRQRSPPAVRCRPAAAVRGLPHDGDGPKQCLARDRARRREQRRHALVLVDNTCEEEAPKGPHLFAASCS